VRGARYAVRGAKTGPGPDPETATKAAVPRGGFDETIVP